METENYGTLQINRALSFKLLKVPVEHNLYFIIDALKGKLQSIMSIYRVYDYINQQRCNEVIIIIRSELEYLVLKEMQRVLIGKQYIELDFTPSYFGSANCSKYMADSQECDLGPSPVSLKINKLTEVSRITTIYLSKILFAFESKEERDVTGISFSYDKKRDSIRPFGFVSFNNSNSVLKYHGKCIRLWEEIVECERSCHIPFLISKPNMVLFKGNSKEFNLDICQANQLYSLQTFSTSLLDSLPSEIKDLKVNEPTNVDTDEQMSESESILSIDFDYDFDEDLNFIKKN